MKKNGSSNALLPVALMLVFALCAIMVLLFAADVYSRAVQSFALNDDSRTALAYISEKIHRCDEKGAVSLGSFDGCESLIIRQSTESGTYCTYIYKYEDSLMELFAEEGAVVPASFGSRICSIGSFEMNEIEKGVFSFRCTDSKGTENSAVVSLKSINRFED